MFFDLGWFGGLFYVYLLHRIINNKIIKEMPNVIKGERQRKAIKSFSIKNSVFEEFRSLSKTQEVSMSAIIEDLMVDYIEGFKDV